jgi:hypothetical protein
MRESINSNPVVQAAFVGVLLLACLFLLYTRVISAGSSGDAASSEPATPPAATTESAAPTATAPAAPGATAPETAAPTGPETAAPTAPPADGAVSPGGLEAGKGMPKPVVDAYEDDKAVVLLVVRQAGIDDKRVENSVQVVEADPDVTVFVTGAKKIARYSQIANGVGVSRVPALIVMKPRSVSDGVPTASVSYGFRSPASVAQAVEDSLYDGRDVPYYPE